MIEKLSIIIPVFNEAQTIEQVLEKVKSVKLIHNISKQVIIIDDHFRGYQKICQQKQRPDF